jgi:hypothetical protein
MAIPQIEPKTWDLPLHPYYLFTQLSLPEAPTKNVAKKQKMLYKNYHHMYNFITEKFQNSDTEM